MSCRNRRYGLCGAIAVAAVAACHPAPHAAAPRLASLPQLRHDLDAMLASPVLERSSWGVLVRSLDRGDTIYDLDARKLLVPASNLKIVTMAVAADRLGWDYRYTTRLFAAGSIVDGVLHGDLLVVGSGDPSLGGDGEPSHAFDDWAAALAARGIRRIDGRVIGDGRALEESLGFGWSWDDLSEGWAAPVSALQVDENSVRVTVTPGPRVGDVAGVAIAPGGSGVAIRSEVGTAAASAAAMLLAHRDPDSAIVDLRGVVPLGGSPLVRSIAVDHPARFFARLLRNTLIAHGIDVRGPAVDVHEVGDAPTRAVAAPLIEYRSPPLSSLAVRLMKSSQNLYAETLLRTLGIATGTPTAAAGRAVVTATLGGWNAPAGGLQMADGSGLSRYNYVSAETLVTILAHVDRDARLRGPFEATLPVAGHDGTLAHRMKGTPAEDNARAKTGSMTAVRALSGYVHTADGEPLVFSILANNYDGPGDAIDAVIDGIVARLAAFRR